MPAALDGFKPFKIFNIFSGDVQENSELKSLDLILSKQDATLHSVVYVPSFAQDWKRSF